MTHKTTQRAALKGWTAQQIAERWGITPRSFSRRAAQASPMFIDAIEGLPTVRPTESPAVYVQTVGRAPRYIPCDYDEAALREHYGWSAPNDVDGVTLNITWGRFEMLAHGFYWHPADLRSLSASEQFADNEEHGRFAGLNILNRGTYE